MGITEVLTSIMKCHGFSIFTTSTFILQLISAIVPYYTSTFFVAVETVEGGLYNIPIRLQKQINTVDLHIKDSLLICKAAIPLIVKTFKKK